MSVNGLKKTALLTAAMLVGTSAVAGGVDHMAAPVVAHKSAVHNQFYIDVHAGKSYQNFTTGAAAREWTNGLSAGVTDGSFDNGSNRAAYGFDVGFSITDAFALEAGYFDFDDVKYSYTMVQAGTPNAKTQTLSSWMGYGAARVDMDLAWFEAFAKLGLAASNNTFTAGADSYSAADNSRFFNYVVGLGMNFELTDDLQLGVQWLNVGGKHGSTESKIPPSNIATVSAGWEF